MPATKLVRRKRVIRPRRKGMRKLRVPRRRFRSSQVPEYASLSVKRSLAGNLGGNFGLGQLYSLMNVQLADYPRAVQVAQAYQHFRIKKIAVTFKSTYDAFQAAAVGSQAKTRLYYMIDKSAAIPTNVALEGLKAMGARPRELDESNVVIQWAPSVLEAAMDAPPISIPSKYRISPWLSTNSQPLQPGAFVPSSVDHLGLYWFLDSINNNIGIQYQVEVEVQFQFKKPLTTILQTQEAVKATVAQINDSPDGIVGGHDDHLATQQ